MKYCALIPAAGLGSRMKGALPKQYLQLDGRPLLWHTLAALSSHPKIMHIALILQANDTHFLPEIYENIPGFAKVNFYYCGGETRAETVTNGLTAMQSLVTPKSWILVHDAARPCLSSTQIDKLIEEVGEDQVGGVLGIPVADTIKRVDTELHIQDTVSREGLWLVQTPQMFRYALLKEALVKSPMVTDEASAIEALGYKPRMVLSSHNNLKVTYPSDLALAEAILMMGS